MALQTVTGKGMLYPVVDPIGTPGFAAVGPIDATGKKIAYCGRVWFPARTGTKDIRYVCFRFGAVTKSGGSGLTLSLQDVDLANGPTIQPDNMQDQTVAIANGNASFAANTWIKTAALSADRTVSYGDLLAVVLEYDNNGRQGSDTVNFASIYTAGAASTSGYLTSTACLYTSSWAQVTGVVPNVVLEFSDGTFGTLDGGYGASALNTHSGVNLGSDPDEYALSFSLPWPCKVDGLWAIVMPSAGTANFEIILYSGTTALATVTVDGNATATSSTRRLLVPISPQTLSANTTYYVAVRPTVDGTNGNLYVFSFDVADANHLTVADGGVACTYTTRKDQGAWAAATTTRRFMAGVRISALDDGAGAASGGGGSVIGSSVIVPTEAQ